MQRPIHITDSIYYIGVNDRRTHLFENMWPLEKGVSYNSYLIKDEKNALIDTVEVGKANDFFDKIDSILEKGEKIDYLIINHLEPDHAGAIRQTLTRYPEMQIIGNKKTFKILGEFYGVDENLHLIDANTVLDLGKHKLSFFQTPMLHWPETMMTYDTTEQILFSGDAFGSYGTLDGGIFDDELNMDYYDDEVRRYYSNIVGKYWNPVQRALTELKGTPLKIIASTHGPIWRKNINKMLKLYDKWSRFEADRGAVIIYGSMYGNTEKMAETIARSLTENGIKDIRIHDSSKTHISHMLNDIFKFKGVALGSSAYNGVIFPPMEQLLSKIINTGIKNRIIGIFGSATWGGGGVKSIDAFADKMKWEHVGEAVQAKGSPSKSDLEICYDIGKKMAERL